MGGEDDEMDASRSRFTNGSQEVILNEVLCFLSTKLDCVPSDVLVLMCTNSFGDADIDKAKKILYQACPPKSSSKLRYTERKEPNKKTKNLNDIIHLLTEYGDNIPVFVAKDLSKLPPIRMDNIDASNLLHRLDSLSTEVSSLKTAVEKVQPLTEEVATLKAAMERLRLHQSVCSHPPTHPPASNVRTDGKKGTSKKSTSQTSTHIAPPTTARRDTAPTVNAVGDSLEEATPSHTYAEKAAANGNWQVAGKPKKSQNRINRTGTADGSNITVIRNKKLLTMFGSRFGPNVKPNDIVCHFKAKGLDVNCESLKARHPDKYASFKVSIRAEDPFPLLRPENWPKGSYFRRFRDGRPRSNERDEADSVSGDV